MWNNTIAENITIYKENQKYITKDSLHNCNVKLTFRQTKQFLIAHMIIKVFLRNTIFTMLRELSHVSMEMINFATDFEILLLFSHAQDL